MAPSLPLGTVGIQLGSSGHRCSSGCAVATVGHEGLADHETRALAAQPQRPKRSPQVAPSVQAEYLGSLHPGGLARARSGPFIGEDHNGARLGKARAVARPMPEPAPVTSATLPSHHLVVEAPLHVRRRYLRGCIRVSYKACRNHSEYRAGKPYLPSHSALFPQWIRKRLGLRPGQMSSRL